MKNKTIRLIIISVFIGGVGVSLAHISSKADAASVTVAASLTVQTSCVSYVNGTTSTYADVPVGSVVNLDATNNDGIVVQDITGSGIPAGTHVDNNSKTTNNETIVSLGSISGPLTVTFTPVKNSNSGAGFVNYCPTVGPTPTSSSLVINPASASLACSTIGTNWNITGSFSGNSLGTGIYNGSTEIAAISGPGSINQTVSAGSNAQTYSVLDGSNYVGKGTTLASVTCPKYTPSAAAASSSGSSLPVSNTSKPAASSTTAANNTTNAESTANLIKNSHEDLAAVPVNQISKPLTTTKKVAIGTGATAAAGVSIASILGYIPYRKGLLALGSLLGK